MYEDALDKAEKSKNVNIRVENINKYFTYSIFANVCRSLFEKDKVLFTFLLLVRIMESKKYLDMNEFHFIISSNIVKKAKSN